MFQGYRHVASAPPSSLVPSTRAGDRDPDKRHLGQALLVLGLAAVNPLLSEIPAFAVTTPLPVANGVHLSQSEVQETPFSPHNSQLRPSIAEPTERSSYLAQANLEHLRDFGYWENLCELLTTTGETDRALAACERAIELKPKEARIWAMHSRVLLDAKRYSEAIASANQALTFDANNSLALTYECMAYTALGQNETALDKCNAALRVNGDWGNQSPALAWRYRGMILGQREQYEQALVAYDRALLLEPKNSLTWLHRCEALVSLSRYPEAIDNCTTALQGDGKWVPENPALAWYYQGIAQTRLDHYQQAIAAYDRAVSLDPNHAPSWTNQGWVLEHLNRPAEALTSYNRAVDLSPKSSQALVGQCTVLNQMQQYEQALAACQKAIQGDGVWWEMGVAQAWNQQSQALAGMGNYEAALAAANRAVGIAPNLAVAWSDRSVVLWYLKNYTEALTSVNRALELDPNAAQAWGNQARIFRSLGQSQAEWDSNAATRYYQQAITSYQRALQLQPNNAELWANQSAVYWVLQDYNNALTAANQALYSAPNSAQAFQNRGAALVGLNRYEEARQSYQRATELDANNADAWASLGVILVQLHQVEPGKAALERALSLNPQQALARNAMHILDPKSP
jgi:tetratricopeptide (TPR) repeat protein